LVKVLVDVEELAIDMVVMEESSVLSEVVEVEEKLVLIDCEDFDRL
jgi:hypothetical protein